jgi:DDE superfamily endonuclease
MWCIGELTKQYRQRMYDLIALYRRAYNSNEPVVCVDEKTKQLLGNIRSEITMKPGVCCKQDSEYSRQGTRNIFVAVEPKAGWRDVQVTQRRCKADFVAFISHLLETRYALANKVHLVVDNLNIHFAKVFVEVLGEGKAHQLLQRIEFHYTPKHGSWLNLAEVEISAMSRQCLNRRIPTETELKVELLAWQTRRNQHRQRIRWKFTKKAADLKLGKYYVA